MSEKLYKYHCTIDSHGCDCCVSDEQKQSKLDEEVMEQIEDICLENFMSCGYCKHFEPHLTLTGEWGKCGQFKIHPYHLHFCSCFERE